MEKRKFFASVLRRKAIGNTLQSHISFCSVVGDAVFFRCFVVCDCIVVNTAADDHPFFLGVVQPSFLVWGISCMGMYMIVLLFYISIQK